MYVDGITSEELNFVRALNENWEANVYIYNTWVNRYKRRLCCFISQVIHFFPALNLPSQPEAAH